MYFRYLSEGSGELPAPSQFACTQNSQTKDQTSISAEAFAHIRFVLLSKGGYEALCSRNIHNMIDFSLSLVRILQTASKK